jgi:hypothetical protein
MQTGSSCDFSVASLSRTVFSELYWLDARRSDVADGFRPSKNEENFAESAFCFAAGSSSRRARSPSLGNMAWSRDRIVGAIESAIRVDSRHGWKLMPAKPTSMCVKLDLGIKVESCRRYETPTCRSARPSPFTCGVRQADDGSWDSCASSAISLTEESGAQSARG